MPIDKGSDRGDHPPDDWERIDLEQAARDKAQRAYDAENDPGEVWEQSARPLPEGYGADRPASRTVTSDQLAEMVELWGQDAVDRRIESGKLVVEGTAEPERGTAEKPGAQEIRDRNDETDRADTADAPTMFDSDRADRVPEFRTPGGKTRGLVQIGGHDVEVVSGRDGPATEIGGNRALGIPDGYVIGSHAEAHAAALLRSEDAPEPEQEADLYLNRRPCGGRAGCDAMLPVMLPPDRKVNVFFMEDPEAPQRPNEVGPMLDNQGRSWRGKLYEGRVEDA